MIKSIEHNSVNDFIVLTQSNMANTLRVYDDR
jgi:hypothetical protein